MHFFYAVPSKTESIERSMRAKLKNLLLAETHSDLYDLMWMCVAKNEPDLLRFLVASSNFDKFEKFPYFCLPWAISNKQFEIAKILMGSGLKFPQYVLEDTRCLISKFLDGGDDLRSEEELHIQEMQIVDKTFATIDKKMPVDG